MTVIKVMPKAEYALIGDIDADGKVQMEKHYGKVIWVTGMFDDPDVLCSLGAEIDSTTFHICYVASAEKILREYYQQIKRWDLIKELNETEKRVKGR